MYLNDLPEEPVEVPYLTFEEQQEKAKRIWKGVIWCIVIGVSLAYLTYYIGATIANAILK